MLTNARTDPDTGLRFYTWKGKYLPSVTSTRRMLGMPFNLHQWTLSKVVDRAVDDAEQVILLRDRAPTSTRERKTAANARSEARRWVRAASTEERDSAADRGTAVHEAIANGLSPEDPSLDPEVKVRLIRYHQFLRETGATVIWKEKQVFNLTYGYAGSGDLLVLLDGDYWMIDTKTSTGVYVDHALQVIAYATAEFVGENDVVDEAATIALRKVTRMGVLHLMPDAWELVEFTASPRLVEAFRLSVKVAMFFNDHPTVDPLVHSTRTK
jgi:hypothetical protein